MNKKISISILIICIILSVFNLKVQAATGSFKVSKSSLSMNPGKTSTFTVSVSNCEGQFTISSSDSSVVTVDKSTEWIDSSFTYTVTAKKAGTATITITASDVADTSEQEVTGSKTIKIKVAEASNNSNNTTNNNTTSNNTTVNNTTSSNNTTSNNTTTIKPQVSTDATLKNLGINPKEYDFSGFKKQTTSYSVTVPNSVDNIYIYAYPTDSNAKVAGIGTKTLKVGENTFSIKVTAEDKKTTKTYNLVVTRKEEEKVEEKPEETKPEEDEKTDLKGIQNIKISGYTLSPSFDNKIYEYNVNIPEKLTKLDIQTETSSDNIEVEMAGNTNLKAGENIITILAHNKEDDTTTSYQITATVGNQEIDLTQVNYEIQQAQASLKKRSWIVKGTIILIVLLIILFLVDRYRLQKVTTDSDDYDTIEDFTAKDFGDNEKPKKLKKSKKGKRYK